MKLRCLTNSIRIRIIKSELAALKKGASLREILELPKPFEWTLQISENQLDYSVDFNNGILNITLPNSGIQDWLHGKAIGLQAIVPGKEGRVIHLLVEKNFPCNSRPDEDKSETFSELQ